MRRDSPDHSEEEPSSLTRPNLLRVPVPARAVSIAPLPTRVASVNVPSVGQRPTDLHSIHGNRDRNEVMHENAAATGVSDDDMDGEDVILTGDGWVVESLYEETLKGDGVDLQKLFDLVNKLYKTQVHLSQSVRQIDARTQQLVATNTTRPANGGGSYVSPPKPPKPINWDQTIQYDEPAGRQCRARRRILLMALIRETIFKLLSRRSVHDPLPPPPPPGLRVPTPLEFAIRWHEYYKSIFNQLAANIVVQKISIEQPGMLTPEELNDLPSMVSSHIKYLCRCYKDQNRDNAEDFNALRLRCCAIGTRKRQLFATRLQVLDRFPEHLGKHRHLIVHLGVDGTSSDEEDPKGSGTYKIKKKPQLSSKVTLLKSSSTPLPVRGAFTDASGNTSTRKRKEYPLPLLDSEAHRSKRQFTDSDVINVDDDEDDEDDDDDDYDWCLTDTGYQSSYARGFSAESSAALSEALRSDSPRSTNRYSSITQSPMLSTTTSPWRGAHGGAIKFKAKPAEFNSKAFSRWSYSMNGPKNSVVDEHTKGDIHFSPSNSLGENRARALKPVVKARSSLYKSGVLPRGLSRIRRPPDGMKIRGKRHKSTKCEIEKWANDTTVEILQLEITQQAKSTQAAGVESEVVNEDSLKELTFDTTLKEVKESTPMLFDTLTRICATSRKDVNNKRDSTFVC
ncbi:hypothetical protein RSOLAG22IIIB_05838 [Rhizoctonia solani]|uniref:Uncharacterized protein n=1 Tax=Rhizoctonia solani TaxID=456999 RepID=A0A0K6G9P2_9AGAM|nr:hypothetical protein RSOLAG22IIIB_05838 [Rhizoctonia solani]